ncbi:MAG: GTP 3',8-cyclase MoaA [Actinobacteria bacterium]|uniref:GTP 3',8-cyclase n=1 Tax=freshwater metagenome TaxID=449393 RepID=A0A6J7QVD2_9ZZZZ|nr:GTP 3',8-cyclase MoaA [Actinomycetota bacterium]MSW91639.1 GTP 3',8-cyclase MoaA [Actinomycetota bacterium]MSX87595.1 GTP 3',8-cyclase MoaA [Actinomycetota bacterium]MSY71716.1 GTP 3',8-cyclase MoaA [Actinomycetota bacterium]
MERPLIDTFGRRHRDLRISITDRCNFRCTYCMPEEGMQWLHRNDILSFEEIERLARLLVERHGIESIRLTGGEPTVRAHLPVLVEKLAALPVDLALTTNGATLRLVAHDLAAAGLKRINISLDTFDRDRFIAITRRDELDKVLDGIDAALEAGLAPVKINAVMMRGVNDDELLDFARFGREKGVVVRFIEFMPLDADQNWTNESVVTAAEIVERIGSVHPLEPMPSSNAPAMRYRYIDGQGEIGIVASVTNAFCDTCDRVRLTAEGKFRNCLFGLEEYDVRGLMRSGASDDELSACIEGAVLAKWAGHQINQVQFIRPHKSMSQIGG